MSASPQSADTLFDEVMEYIRASRAILQEGNLVELKGLDAKVEELCRGIIELPQEEAKRFEEDLVKLQDEVEKLRADLVTSRDGLQEELMGVGKHQKANIAYQSSQSLPMKKKEGGEDSSS